MNVQHDQLGYIVTSVVIKFSFNGLRNADPGLSPARPSAGLHYEYRYEHAKYAPRQK